MLTLKRQICNLLEWVVALETPVEAAQPVVEVLLALSNRVIDLTPTAALRN